MIKVLDIFEKDIDYTIEYYKSTNVINIETTLMIDNCKPFRESTGCMVWLNEENYIGEIECISPIITEMKIVETDSISTIQGLPKLEVNFEEKAIDLLITNETLTIIFNREKEINKKCISSNVTFYLHNNELISLGCKNFELIE